MFELIRDAIAAHQTIILHRHTNPDGDALGSQVEFLSPEKIRTLYPRGVRDMSDCGSWDTIAGQITDDSEMAIMLARTLVRQGGYTAEGALTS